MDMYTRTIIRTTYKCKVITIIYKGLSYKYQQRSSLLCKIQRPIPTFSYPSILDQSDLQVIRDLPDLYKFLGWIRFVQVSYIPSPHILILSCTHSGGRNKCLEDKIVHSQEQFFLKPPPSPSKISASNSQCYILKVNRREHELVGN